MIARKRKSDLQDTGGNGANKVMRAPQKRKSDVTDTGGSGARKVMKIITEPGVVASTSGEDDKSKDRTLDNGEKELPELCDSEHTNTQSKTSKGELKTEVKTEKTVIKYNKGAQTVPTVVKFASPEEVDLLSLSPIEQKQMLLLKAREVDEKDRELDEKERELDQTKKSLALISLPPVKKDQMLQGMARELDETKKSLTSIQANIWHLLKIIIPDFDYGNPQDIEAVILEFIRANGGQDGQAPRDK